MSSDEKIHDLKENKGIFGFGFSHNNNLDLFNLVILAYAGIFIQFFFSSSYDKHGLNGPATLSLWGNGLTGIAIFLMIFISIYINNKKTYIITSKHTFEDTQGILDAIKSIFLTDSLPIVLTLGIIFYIFFINYTYFERINKGLLPDTYNTYYLFSSILLISQIGLIVKYLYNELESLVTPQKINSKETVIIKSLSYILLSLNFVFILIMHILVEFFSTNG